MRVIFDMDGVLVDVSGSFRRAVIETAAELGGGHVSPAEVQEYKDRGGFNNDWVLTHTILRERGVTVGYEEVVRAFNSRYRGQNWDGLILEEPALINASTLESLAARGTMALVTGRPRGDAQFTLERFGWSHFFPVLVGMEDQNGREKPDPYPLKLALQWLGEEDGSAIEPSAVAYVGDTVDDMRAAVRAGMVAIGAVPPYLDERHADVLREAGAQHVVTDLERLPDALRQISSRE